MVLTFDFNIHTSAIIKTKEDKWGQTCNMHSLDEICIQNFEQKTWKSLFAIPRNKRNYNINIDLKGIVWESWINMTQDRVQWCEI
jgi:hypothetical protein